MSEASESDTEFDAFLQEAVQKEKEMEDIKVVIQEINRVVSDALDEAGYIPVETNLEQMLRIRSDVNEEQPDMTAPELIQIEVDKRIALQANHEEATVTTIKLLVTAAHVRTDSPTPEKLNEQKRTTYARLVSKDRYPNDDRLMAAFNSVTPGDPINPDAAYMIPYYAQAIQAAEADEYESLQRQAELSTIIKTIVKIDENDPEWNRYYAAVSLMYLTAMPYLHRSDMNRANLTEALYERTSRSIGPDVRRRLIEFFSNYEGGMPANQ